MIKIIQNLFSKYKRFKKQNIILICSSARSGSTALFNFFSQHPDVKAYNESRILFAVYYFLIQTNRIKNLNKNSNFLNNELQKIYYNYKFNTTIRNSFDLMNKIIVEKEAFDIIGLPNYDYEDFMRETLRAFSNIKIVFIVRHPVSTINSMLKRKWGYSLSEHLKQDPAEYSLEECIAIWNKSTEAAKNIGGQEEFKNRFFVIKFENLVEKPETISKQLYDFTKLAKYKNFDVAKTSAIDLPGKSIKTIKEKTKVLMGYYDY